jgi:hypothetical protein
MILVVEENRLQSAPPIHHMINRRLKFQTGFSWHASLFVNPPGKARSKNCPIFVLYHSPFCLSLVRAGASSSRLAVPCRDLPPQQLARILSIISAQLADLIE